MIEVVPPPPLALYSPPVAALYVDTARGPYPHIAGVDCWGRASKGEHVASSGDRDARGYNGPHPVIAHPPCGPWGRFYWRYKGGEGDASCGLRAVEQVRDFGGVLEHPENSSLWRAAGIPDPGMFPDQWGGYTLEVDQVDFGHPCRKRTWLYIVGVDPREIPPLPPAGTSTHVMVRRLHNRDDRPELPKRYRHLTPWRFAWWLCRLASRAGKGAK